MRRDTLVEDRLKYGIPLMLWAREWAYGGRHPRVCLTQVGAASVMARPRYSVRTEMPG
jgi:hypothetical protein